MEITRREIIVSIFIVSLMLIVGLMLSDNISDSIINSNEIYNKAIHIEDEDLFKYGMRTSVGNSFVYGDLIAVDPVSYPELDGEYLYVRKVKERYTQHTRTVSYKCGKTTCYRTQVYWTWDRVGFEKKTSERVEFLGVEFNFNQFNRPSTHHLTTIKTSPTIRYKYYVVPSKVTGTIIVDLRDNSIGENVSIYENMTIEEAYESAISGGTYLILFWVVWIVLTGVVIYSFYYLKNEWLY